ncbi:hypothetical protein BHE74_00029134 [Ensete ventricosum]|nr:hypothetical protein BHE74_00029134 [Ensete ventricosum]
MISMQSSQELVRNLLTKMGSMLKLDILRERSPHFESESTLNGAMTSALSDSFDTLSDVKSRRHSSKSSEEHSPVNSSVTDPMQVIKFTVVVVVVSCCWRISFSIELAKLTNLFGFDISEASKGNSSMVDMQQCSKIKDLEDKVLLLQQQLNSFKSEQLHEEFVTEEISDMKRKLQSQVIFIC